MLSQAEFKKNNAKIKQKPREVSNKNIEIISVFEYGIWMTNRLAVFLFFFSGKQHLFMYKKYFINWKYNYHLKELKRALVRVSFNSKILSPWKNFFLSPPPPQTEKNTPKKGTTFFVFRNFHC